jgi:flagellar biosynthesis protein FlhF
VKILKFEGSNMREAVAKVKAELGDQAVIVATRQIRRGLLGTACEISAAIDDDDDNEPVRLPRGFGALAHAAGPSTGPQPAMQTQAQAAQRDEETERMLGSLKSEIKSLRALVRAQSGDTKMTTELRNEVASLRKLVEDLKNLPQPTPPAGSARGTAPIANSQLTAPSTGRCIMLVGPTGVGKTTTIAKLAARAALIENKRVALITLDNYRVGGIDQIRTFADLIGVPLKVVASPADLADAIDDNDDLTLIDTAGRSPRDSAAIAELAAGMRQCPPIETHLVVSAGSTAMAIESLCNRYRALQPARMLFTKVDEIETSPEMARAPLRLELPITWITTGQSVPEDLEEPTNERVLEVAATGLGAAQAA